MLEESFHQLQPSRLLKQFDFFTRRMCPELNRVYGKELASEMLKEGRQEFEGIIPQFPETGIGKMLAMFANATGMYLALYRVTLRHGRPLEETGKVIYDSAEYLIHHIPFFFSRMFAGMNFSTKYLAELQRQAAESKSGIKPDGYVLDYVPGDGKTFDYGIDYVECASVKFLNKQGTPELGLYFCPIDILYSDAVGWGLHRTMTLADGDPKCDFRFKKGGSTDMKVKVLYYHSRINILWENSIPHSY